MIFFTDDVVNRLKNFSADLPVKPIVNNLIIIFFWLLRIRRVSNILVA